MSPIRGSSQSIRTKPATQLHIIKVCVCVCMFLRIVCHPIQLINLQTKRIKIVKID